MEKLKKIATTFIFGFFIYMGMEIIWGVLTKPMASKSFIGLVCMGIIGGILLNLMGLLNERDRIRKLPTILHSLIATIMITITEFCIGCLLNLRLGLNIWDYSDHPLNIMGQVCLPYILLWFALCPLFFWIDDRLRWVYYKTDLSDTGQERYTLLESYKRLFTT